MTTKPRRGSYRHGAIVVKLMMIGCYVIEDTFEMDLVESIKEWCNEMSTKLINSIKRSKQ